MKQEKEEQSIIQGEDLQDFTDHERSNSGEENQNQGDQTDSTVNAEESTSDNTDKQVSVDDLIKIRLK